MTSFNEVFGGNALAPSQQSLLSLTLTTNVQLSWPTEQSPSGQDIVSDIIEVNATVPGLSIMMPDAQQSSTGYVALFNNIGANTFSVLDNLGHTLMAPTSGSAWLIYLVDNSTQAGVWRVFQFGAGVSNANAASLAGAGLKAVTTTLNERIAVQSKNVNYTIVDSDRATCIEWTGGNGALITPNPGVVGSDWFCYLSNQGTGVVSLTPPAGEIDGQATINLNPLDAAILVTDGVNFLTIGLGQSAQSIFNFVSIDVSGSGNYTLSGANLNRVSYKFTGVLTGNRKVIVPNTVQQYWVDNETTGPFTLTFQAAALGASVTVPQGSRNILYCDGANVVEAVTFGATGFPDGSAGSPSITFLSDATTGLYKAAATTLGFAAGGRSGGTLDENGDWVIPAPVTGVALTTTGATNWFAQKIFGDPTAGQSFGLAVAAGTNNADVALLIRNQAQSQNFLEIFGDGGIVVGAPAGGDKGLGSINASAIFQGGVALSASAFSNTTDAGNITSGLLAVARGGTGDGTAPAAGQILIAQSGTDYHPETVSGDGTLSSAGALAVTKTGGVAFAASATTDTTNASNISAGTLPVGRIPNTAAQVWTIQADPGGTPGAGTYGQVVAYY